MHIKVDFALQSTLLHFIFDFLHSVLANRRQELLPSQGVVPDTGRADVPDTGRAVVPDTGRAVVPDIGRVVVPDIGRAVVLDMQLVDKELV